MMKPIVVQTGQNCDSMGAQSGEQWMEYAIIERQCRVNSGLEGFGNPVPFQIVHFNTNSSKNFRVSIDLDCPLYG